MNVKTVYKSAAGKEKIINHYNSLLSQLAVPFKERYIETSYGTTHVIESGDASNPPVFLLHGSCSNSTMWIGDIPILAKDYHVYAIDIIGEPGKSDENRLDLKSDDYAMWLKELCTKLNAQKVIMIGNSYGGWLSLKFATTYPECVSKMALIATSGISPTKLSFVMKSIVYTMQGKKGLDKLNKMIYGRDDVPQEILDVTNMIVDNFIPMMGALPTYTDQQLSRLDMPVMYIAGENDVTVDAEKTANRMEAHIEHAHTELIKDCGHVVYDVMNRVIPFLKK